MNSLVEALPPRSPVICFPSAMVCSIQFNGLSAATPSFNKQDVSVGIAHGKSSFFNVIRNVIQTHVSLVSCQLGLLAGGI